MKFYVNVREEPGYTPTFKLLEKESEESVNLGMYNIKLIYFA